MITKAQVIEEAARLALTEPNRTNNGVCRYLKEDGTPNCIASQVLFNLGVPTNVLQLGDPIDSLSAGKKAHAVPCIDAYAEADALMWLDSLQAAADFNMMPNGIKANWDAPQGSTPWSEALRLVVG